MLANLRQRRETRVAAQRVEPWIGIQAVERPVPRRREIAFELGERGVRVAERREHADDVGKLQRGAEDG